MRIALLHERYGSGGGNERYMSALGEQLHAAGNEIHIVTTDHLSRSTQKEHEEKDFCTLHYMGDELQGSGRKRRLEHFSEKAGDYALKLKPDIVLGFGRSIDQHIHRAGAGCHAAFSKSLPFFKKMRPMYRLEHRIEKELYTSGRTRHFVVNSQKVGNEIQEHYRVAAKDISLIRTAVDSQHFKKDLSNRAELRKELGLAESSDKTIFLSLSLDHRRKGIPELLRAFHDIPRAQLWIVGSELTGRSKKLLENHPNNKNIHYMGVASDSLTYLQAADIFVHPTHYDACANTVLQAMSCELPSIVSSNDGASELIKHRQNGFLLEDPKKREELRMLLLESSEMSQSSRAEMGRLARETTLPLTWKAHLSQWSGLFSREISGY